MTQPMSGAAVDTASSRGGKYLTFWLADEQYGVEILRVRELIGMMAVTAVPRTPEFVRGVINLRGRIIPVVDLRAVLGMKPIQENRDTCIIVVEIDGGHTGVVVDRVAEVRMITEECIEDAPSFGSSVDTRHVLGMGKLEEQVTILLDINRVLTDDQFKTLASFAHDAGQTESE